MEKKRLHYGWIIVLACFIITMFIQLETNIWSYFQIPVSNDLGCTYVVFNLTTMLGTVANMLFGLTFASRIGRGNLRLYMLIGGLAAGAIWFLQAYVTQIWMLFVTYGLMNFMLGMILYIPINILMANWFIDRKAFALSLGLLGSSVGQMLFSAPVSSAIEKLGWRPVSQIFGIVTAVATIIVFLLVRKTPAEKGLEPYRNSESGNNDAKKAAGASWMGVDKKTALHTKAFWAFSVVMICVGLISSGIITQLPTFLSESGLNYAPIMVVYSIMVIISKLTIGPLFDKIGVFKGTVVCSTFLAVSLVLMTFVSGGNTVIAYIATIFYSLGCTIGALTPPLMVSGIFGYKDYGGIYGIANFFFYGGAMLGSIISSGIRTAAGSYTPAWITFLFISIVLILGSLLCSKLAKSLRAENPG